MNWLDIFVIIVSIYGIFKGYKSGLVKQLASLAAVVACIMLSGKISAILLPYLHRFENIPRNLTEPITFIISFILIFAVFMLLGHMLQSILHTVKLGTLNKLSGAVLCLAKWMIIMSLFINLFVEMDNKHLIISADIESNSKTYQYIKPIAPEIVPYLKFNFE